MKYKLIAFAVIVLIFCTTGLSWAEPLKVTGDVRIRYQDRSGDVDSSRAPGDHTITRIRVNMETEIVPRLNVYARLAMEQAAGLHHNNGLYDTAGVFDRWGAEYKFRGGSIRLGKQDVVLGPDGLVMTTLIDAVGRDNQLTGATVKLNTFPNTTVKLVGGQLGSGLFQPLNGLKANLYAAQIDRRLDRTLAVGVTWRRTAAIDNYSSFMAEHIGYGAEFDTYSVFANYYLDKSTALYTEIGRSSSKTDNNAFSLGAAHRFDNKNSISLNYFKQDAKAVMLGNWGAPDFTIRNGSTTWQGFANYYRYQMTDSTLLEVSDYYEMGNNTKSANQFRLNVIKAF